MIRDMIRGTGYLPYVGHNNGTGVLVFFVILGAIGGSNRGPAGVFIGGVVMFAVFFPIWASGCVGRARFSDALAVREELDA